MKEFFEVTAKFVKISDDGAERKVSECYLLDAVSFTSAEMSMTEQLATFVRGEFVIGKITKSKIIESFEGDGDLRWKIKTSMVTIDEWAGKEKRVSEYWLVQADTIEGALSEIKKNLEWILVPYSIDGIALSNIVDVFQYQEKEVA